MYVSKEMLHAELRRYYYPAKWIACLLSKRWGVRLLRRLEGGLAGKNIDDLHSEEIFIPSNHAAHQIRARIFRHEDVAGPLPGFLYLHGGGYMIGNPEFFIEAMQRFIAVKPCVIVAPDYRKAMDAPYPAALDDCYDTLLWMHANAHRLGIISEKYIVGGHSAGGGLTAAISLKARDTQDVQIAFQMPIYPMIDDRQLTESARHCAAPAWSSKSNQLGWHAYLRDLKHQNMDIPAYAAAARASDYAGLPPTITFVGELEPFRDETIQYVEALRKEGIPVAFNVYKGCFHGFEMIAPRSSPGQAAWQFVLNAFSDYAETYLNDS